MQIKGSIYQLLLAVLVIILVILVEPCLAQSREFDSLEAALKTVKYNDKADLLIEIGGKATHLNFDERKHYYEEAIDVAKQNNYIKGQALAWYRVAKLYSSYNKPEEALKYFLISGNLYKKINDDENVARCNISVADQVSDLGDNEKALGLYNKVLKDANNSTLKHLMAVGYNNAGLVYSSMGKTDSALVYFYKAKEINEKLSDSNLLGNLYNNIGMVYANTGVFDSCLSYFQLAVKAYEKLGDHKNVINTLGNIGVLYRMYKDYPKALDYQQRALKRAEIYKDERVLANIHNSLGVLYERLDSLEMSLEHYRASLNFYQNIRDKQGEERALINIGTTYQRIEKYDLAIEYFNKAMEINTFTQNRVNRIAELQALGLNRYYQKNYREAVKYYKKSLNLAHSANLVDLVQNLTYMLAENYEEWHKYDSALYFYRQYQEVKDSVFTQKQLEQIAELETRYDTEKKEAQIKIQKASLERKTIENRKQTMLILFLGIVFLLVVWGVWIVFRSLKQKQKHHEIIRKEKEKSEKLLLNILPEKIAEDLKLTGRTEPENFENVTVYFSDIINFTQISEHTDPEKLIDRLNEMFTAMDDIMVKYHCERIKTIGDAYLAVSGMPVPDTNHAANMLLAALEIRNYLKEFNESGDIKFYIRIGINSGEVVGGVVGVRKYIYDVFGDTINTASRMEANSEAMKINVSDTTKQLVNGQFDFDEREEISVKGKGMMKMWFLKGKK